MSTVRCPICDRAFESEGALAMPFCSRRCQLVDLNRWTSEDYGIPIEEDSPSEEDSGEHSDRDS